MISARASSAISAPSAAARHPAADPVADDGDDTLVVRNLDALYLTAFEFLGKRIRDHLSGTLRDIARHGDTDRVFRTGLRDQGNGYTGLLERPEQTIGGTRHTDHTRALEVYDRHATDRRDALDAVDMSRIGSDPTPGMCRIMAVANPDRNVLGDHRTQGLGMYDLGAKIRQLHRLVVGHLVDHPGLRNAVWISAHDAIDVGPDAQLGCVGERGEYRGGIIAAVAAQRGLQSILVGRDKARDDRNPLEVPGQGVVELRL
mgnify:CR=1 FL=1